MTGRTSFSPATRARRTVLWFASALAATTAGLAVALDTRLPVVRYPEHGHRLAELRAARASHPDRPLVLFIGSSRTQVGVRPSETGFGSSPTDPLVFNYGLPGACPAHLALGYQRLRSEGVRPAAVVVEVLPPLLAVGDVSPSHYADQGPGLTVRELRNLGPDLARSVVARKWLASRCLALGHFATNLHRELPLPAPPHEHLVRDQTRSADFGYTPFAYRTDAFSTEEYERAFDHAREQYASLCRALTVSPSAYRAYRDLVSAGRADGVPVAFYVTPESPAFRGWYTPKSRDAVTEFVRFLRTDLGAKVFEPADEWAEVDFVDGHHFTPDGAAKFSRRLTDTHLRLWLAAVLPSR